MLIEEEDFKGLRDSVDAFDKYDALALARTLEKHDLLEFRRIAAHLYRKMKRWQHAIDLAKQDRLWKDAIEIAAVSNSTEIVEDLARYFVQVGNKEVFAAMLYTCYHLFPLDLVMELTWRYGLNDYTMPYMINHQREQSQRLQQLHLDNEERKKKEVTAKEEEGPMISNPLMITSGMTNGFGYGYQ